MCIKVVENKGNDMLKYGKILEKKILDDYEVRAQRYTHPMGKSVSVRIFKGGKPFVSIERPSIVDKVAVEFLVKYANYQPKGKW